MFQYSIVRVSSESHLRFGHVSCKFKQHANVVEWNTSLTLFYAVPYLVQYLHVEMVKTVHW